tara:strand:+ start:491 stop:1108 length:618 start_codon:yes stop_codon:yes gene_type:complete
MSKKLLTEFFELCKDGICQDLLTEREKREVSNGATYLSGRIQAADTPNGNGRVYPKKVLEKEIKNYLNVVKDNRATGELDHPEDSVINLKNVSHLMVDVWWQGNDVMGKMKVLDTPSGRILKDLMNAGVKLGISSRGLGTVKENMNGHDVVEEDFQLICFDIVSEPSTPGAFVHPEGKRAASFAKTMRENKQNQIDNLFDRILKD